MKTWHGGWLGAALLVAPACGGDAFESDARARTDAAAGDVGSDAPSRVDDAASGGIGGSAGAFVSGGASGAGGASGGIATGGEAGAAGSAGAAPEDAGTDASCDLVLYLDGDSDGYGGTTTSTGCEGTAGWVTLGGDCDDSEPDAHPGQTSYFVDGYVKTGSTEISFDYDCDGSESEAGTSPKASCHVMSLQCVGAGYVVATPPRAGPGVDPFCGSKSKVPCVGSSLKCDPGTPYDAPAIACR